MSFFDTEIPEPHHEPVQRRPEWAGPPRGVLPGQSTQRAVIFKSDDLLLLVHRFVAYPTGIEFTINLWLRNPDHGLDYMPWEMHRRPGRPPDPEDLLRFGLLLSDGWKWTNLDSPMPPRGKTPVSPFVIGRGGGGGSDSWRATFWMWPLPPEGPMTFVASWPIHGVEESTGVVDATELRTRAAEAEIIWPV